MTPRPNSSPIPAVVKATHEPDEDRIREAVRILLRDERATEGRAA